ncbi:MAG: hypothetical protein HOD85_23725 [Deltaproteobacteria bacterium]|nr:hypothetical protein [Deltaproteobacteria bacterium]
MDSGAAVSAADKGQIVVAGSHCSEFAARYVAKFEPFGIVLHDAGRGKNDAGISGLPLFQALGTLAAAVDGMSAHIGEGEDTYNHGRISALNQKASDAGVEIGMPVKETARLMFKAKEQAVKVSDTAVVLENESGRVILADTIIGRRSRLHDRKHRRCQGCMGKWYCIECKRIGCELWRKGGHACTGSGQEAAAI